MPRKYTPEELVDAEIERLKKNGSRQAGAERTAAFESQAEIPC